MSERNVLTIAVITLLAMAAAALWAIGTRQLAPALLLAALSVLWLLANHPLEGPVLWTLAPGRGLVLTDLLAPIGVGTAAVCRYPAWRRWRQANRASGEQQAVG